MYMCKDYGQTKRRHHNATGEKVCQLPTGVATGVSIIDSPCNKVRDGRQHIKDEDEKWPVYSVRKRTG